MRCACLAEPRFRWPEHRSGEGARGERSAPGQSFGRLGGSDSLGSQIRVANGSLADDVRRRRANHGGLGQWRVLPLRGLLERFAFTHREEDPRGAVIDWRNTVADLPKFTTFIRQDNLETGGSIGHAEGLAVAVGLIGTGRAFKDKLPGSKDPRRTVINFQSLLRKLLLPLCHLLLLVGVVSHDGEIQLHGHARR